MTLPAAVQLVAVTKRFGKVTAVNELDLEVLPGEFFSILGPSGCGKTTTLRIIAGLEEPTRGEVMIGGAPVTGVPTHRRNVGMVFQDYALFPHMKVADNIAFGLRMRGRSRRAIREAVDRALDLIQLPDIADRYPHQLSGGQQQRVALARALAPEPDVLLLDEPLSNLDLKLRQQLRLELRRLQRALGVTAIFVTHDQGEALSLSDRILLMRHGRPVQLGTPAAMYRAPADRWVASFLGDSNFFTGGYQTGPDGLARFTDDSGILFQPTLSADWVGELDPSQQVTLAIRPEAIRLFPEALAAVDGDKYDLHTVVVENFAYEGSGTRYVVRLSGASEAVLLVDVPAAEDPWPEGTRLTAGFPRRAWVPIQTQA